MSVKSTAALAGEALWPLRGGWKHQTGVTEQHRMHNSNKSSTRVVTVAVCMKDVPACCIVVGVPCYNYAMNPLDRSTHLSFIRSETAPSLSPMHPLTATADRVLQTPSVSSNLHSDSSLCQSMLFHMPLHLLHGTHLLRASVRGCCCSAHSLADFLARACV